MKFLSDKFVTLKTHFDFLFVLFCFVLFLPNGPNMLSYWTDIACFGLCQSAEGVLNLS